MVPMLQVQVCLILRITSLRLQVLFGNQRTDLLIRLSNYKPIGYFDIAVLNSRQSFWNREQRGL